MENRALWHNFCCLGADPLRARPIDHVSVARDDFYSMRKYMLISYIVFEGESKLTLTALPHEVTLRLIKGFLKRLHF